MLNERKAIQIYAMLRGNIFQFLLIASINDDEDERLLIKVKATNEQK